MRAQQHFDNPLVDWWPSPAKINLFLHVCGRFDNGYHELETLFQLLDFGDEIGFEHCKRDDADANRIIKIADPIDGVADTDNLIYKAASLLLPHKQTKDFGVRIHMRKSIPMGGGLGGGSSNAATVLVALNQLWNCQLSLAQLLKEGVKLGADVPIFIHGHSSFAGGIGERLTNVVLHEYYYLVATPNEHITTEAVFKHPDLPRNTQKLDLSAMASAIENGTLFDITQNDCEKLVCNAHPKVANLLQWLLNYAPSRMTGTGASVFAQFASLKEAQNVLSQVPKGIYATVCKGLNKSPLHEKLTQVCARD